MAHDFQIVRAKEKFKLSYGGPSQGQVSGINQRIKALRQCRHLVRGLTHPSKNPLCAYPRLALLGMLLVTNRYWFPVSILI